MTVEAELLKQAMQLAYFVTIEGVGWPLNGIYSSAALAGTFRGRVWVSGYKTELAAVLGCSVSSGLQVSGAVSEKADLRTGELKIGGISFEIQDNDDWWLQNYTPRRVASDTTIYAASPSVVLSYESTTIPLVDGTDFVEGDQVWLGGRELVTLGVKSVIAGVQCDYTGSTRGVLGTRRGSALRRPQDYSFGVWPSGTSVSSIARWWRNRKVALWAIVPGESEPMCLWYGKLRTIKNPKSAGTFNFDCAGDFLGELSRKHVASEWVIYSDTISNLEMILNGIPNYDNQVQAFQAANKCRRRIEFLAPGDRMPPGYSDQTSDGKYALAAAYNYRWQTGGTAGMVSTWDAGGVQALWTADDAKMLRSFVLINDQVIQLIKTDPITDYAVQDNPRAVLAEIISSAGTTGVVVEKYDTSGKVWTVADESQAFNFAPGTKARFLLDNYDQGYNNRFLLDGSPMTHPIDYLLAFLTSMDRELARFAITVASTTTNIVNSVNPGWTTDMWVGYALACAGANTAEYPAYAPPYNKFLSRWITANTNDDVTVEKGFPNTPDATYEEYQVRNGIWDCLPIGWGMGVDVRTLDIDSFQHIKVNHLQGAKLAKFILGTQNELNIWEMLRDNILGPYGILLRFDRVKRKIGAVYVGEPLGNGVIDDYVDIAQKQIKGPGAINDDYTNPIRAVELEVRATENRIVALQQLTSTKIQAIFREVPALFGGGTSKIELLPKEMEAAFSDAEMDTIKATALFNTPADAEAVITRLTGLLSQYVIPPPVWTGPLDIELYPDLYPGCWVLINWTSPAYPTNPLTGQRGWTNVIGRVTELSIPIGGKLVFDCSIELFATILGGRVAPATKITAKGSDANGNYFDVGADNYNASAPTLKDWWFWEVGDVLEWRDVSGARKAASSGTGYTITGFGTNFASTPEAATGNRIYVTEAITPAVVTTDYLTFFPWTAGQASRKDLYSALADASLGLGADPDDPRRYG